MHDKILDKILGETIALNVAHAALKSTKTLSLEKLSFLTTSDQTLLKNILTKIINKQIDNSIDLFAIVLLLIIKSIHDNMTAENQAESLTLIKGSLILLHYLEAPHRTEMKISPYAAGAITNNIFPIDSKINERLFIAFSVTVNKIFGNQPVQAIGITMEEHTIKSQITNIINALFVKIVSSDSVSLPSTPSRLRASSSNVHLPYHQPQIVKRQLSDYLNPEETVLDDEIKKRLRVFIKAIEHAPKRESIEDATITLLDAYKSCKVQLASDKNYKWKKDINDSVNYFKNSLSLNLTGKQKLVIAGLAVLGAVLGAIAGLAIGLAATGGFDGGVTGITTAFEGANLGINLGAAVGGALLSSTCVAYTTRYLSRQPEDRAALKFKDCLLAPPKLARSAV